MAGPVQIEILSAGDVNKAPMGSHLVLEARSGALLHAVRMPDGILAFRSGQARMFRAAKAFPSAAVVHYPPPFRIRSDTELTQAVDRACTLIGFSAASVLERLIRAGASAYALSEGGEVLESECVASFCAIGVCRLWRVVEAYCAARFPKFGDVDGLRSGEAFVTRTWFHGSCGVVSPAIMKPPLPTTTSPAISTASTSQPIDQKASSRCSIESDENRVDGLTGSLHENAIHTAMHCGLRGPAAKVAGTAAAIGCEGYKLYHEISGHGDKLVHRKISEGQYQERVCESTITCSSRAIGGFAGAAAGQVAIPVPVLGAVVGSVVGATCGGLHAESLVRGAWRLSGGKAKGGDDLVRCVEHYPKPNGERPDLVSSACDASTDQSLLPSGSTLDAKAQQFPGQASESIWDDGPLL